MSNFPANRKIIDKEFGADIIGFSGCLPITAHQTC